MSKELLKQNIEKAQFEIDRKKDMIKSGKMRQHYHFMPQTGWLNDPNGLIYFRGKYHFFFQHNPYSGFWDSMHWGHAVSDDMLHWEYLPLALVPSEKYDNHQKGGCFSGSAIEHDGKLFLMYTGVTNEGNGYEQVQCIAYSEDGIHFEYKNSYQEPTIGNMWECPDVFKINNQFFMIFSPENTDLPPKPNSNARYMPIDFEEDTLTIKEHGDWPYLDHGLDFYAPQTFLSKDNERILLGWLRMRKPVQGEEWVGMFIMPRVLKEKEGKIIQELYPEIKNSFNQEIQDISFDQPFQLKTTLNKDSSLNLGGFKIDIQDDCLHLNREEVSIQENKVCNDVISPKLQGHYDIELYYDHHVFEIYINGGEYVMSQVVYDLKDQIVIQNTEYKVYVRSL